MNARQLAVKWLNMPLHVQIELMRAAGAWKSEDTNLPSVYLLNAFVARAGAPAAIKAISDHEDRP